MSQSQIPTIEDSPPPAALRLYTLGSAALVRADGEILLTPSKPLALLTYLHCSPGRSATREHLANLLWSESRSQRAGAALRTTLNRMRSAIGDPAPDDLRPEVTLRAPILSDRDSFLEALGRKDFAAAMGLYGGPFFPNYSDAGTVDFEHWVDLERARLQECFLRATESLVSRALDAGHAREAVRIALRVRALAPDSEEGWRVLLRALLAAGDSVIAHGELEALGTWLNEQGRQPEPSTARLMAQVRAGAPETTETTPESPALLPDLVGREKQFSSLITAWRSVRDGGSRHLHLSGAAGLGKTRLLADLARRLGEEGAPVVSLRANPGERAVEYAFAGELARVLATCPGAQGISPPAAAILVGLQPSLANQFPSARPVYQGSDLLHQRAQAVAELLAAVTEDHPLVLLLDDLHWLDPGSRQIVEVVTGRLDRGRVLLVTAARDGYALTPDLSPGAELTLEPLTQNQTEELLAGLGRFPDAEWGRRVSVALQHATGGSPLLVLEALTLARERDEIALADGVWTCPDLDALLRRLSEQEVLGARLNELEPSERRVLLALAVAGTPLDEAALAQGCATGPEDAGELFLALECRGYLRSLDGVIVPGHDAMAEAVIALSSREEIAAAHVAVGRALSQSGEKNPILLRLAARHLMAGGDEAGLGALYRGYAAGARQRGDGRASAAIARELLGEETDPARVRHLVGSLPLRARIRMRYVLPAAAIALVGGVGAGFALVRPPAETPDAMLLSFEIRPLNGNIEVRRHPIFEDRWKIGDSIMASGGRTERVCRARVGAAVYRWAVGPADELVFEGPSPDSGHIDLYACARSGTVTRLTDTPGDDIHPSWSADGRFLAFSTARWTPRDDQDADIAVLDPRTHAARQLTRGPDYDTTPVWSPDGTRIAFARRSAADGAHRICWVTADGGVERCARPHWSAGAVVIGWRDPETVAVIAGESVGSNSVEVVGVDNDSSRVLLAGDYGLALVSPDGRWVLVDDGNVATRQGFEVVPWADPSRARPVARPERSNVELAWAPTPGRNHPLARVRIRPPASSLPPGVTSRLSVEGFDSGGGRLAIPPAVLHWSVSDGSLATIDSVDGTLRPLAQGTVVVRVSAGGWREDSLAIRILPADVRTVWRERWNDSLLTGWLLQGKPVPRVVPDSGGSEALLVDGDGYFVSGVVSRTGFEVTRGLGADVRVSTPIRRPKWQRLAVQLIANPKVDEGGIWNDYACGATLPPSEGQPAMTTMQLTAGREYVSIETGDRLRSGSWYTLRVQLFPDGTCGMAIDGKPLWRSRSSYHRTAPLHVAFTGQSVATRMLVGPVEVWEGIRGGVDWSALDTPAIARAGAGSAVRKP